MTQFDDPPKKELMTPDEARKVKRIQQIKRELSKLIKSFTTRRDVYEQREAADHKYLDDRQKMLEKIGEAYPDEEYLKYRLYHELAGSSHSVYEFDHFDFPGEYSIYQFYLKVEKEHKHLWEKSKR